MANEEVQDMQEQIVLAIKNNDKLKSVYRLQIKLINSFAGRAIAVRRVVTNKGSRTPGIDNKILEGHEDYMAAIKILGQITSNPKEYKAQPLRRVYIPKANGERRGLGIPTINDRLVQAVYHLAVDPVVEQLSDLSSFGFRKEKSTMDAVDYFRNYMDKRYSPNLVLEADIRKCFDRISHEFLMVNTPICHKSVLEQWLKCGVFELGIVKATLEGTPQGGIISPMLCNVAMNGLEKAIREESGIDCTKNKVKIIRYADDVVITGNSVEVLEKCKDIMIEFLIVRGLELNLDKTKITDIRDGLDLLGYNIRRRP